MVLFSELEYDHENPIPRSEDDDVERLYFEAEKSFMAPKGYAKDKAAAELRERAGFVIAAVSRFTCFFVLFDPIFFFYFFWIPGFLRSTQRAKGSILSCRTSLWTTLIDAM